MFFVVDIETSDTDPLVGVILSIGCVAVPEHGPWPEFPDAAFETFYEAISPENLDWMEHWHPGQPTYDWWHEQDPEVLAEALSGKRSEFEVMSAFAQWVTDTTPEGEKAYFVANPSTFDHGFVQASFTAQGVENPFHYRTLCLRSMRFGMEPGHDWGGSRDHHKPHIAHHALHDATAEAFDLMEMLSKRAGF